MPYSVSPQRNLASFQPGNVEAQIEFLALHPAELGHHEVAQLVDEDHHAQADRDLEDVDGPSQTARIGSAAAIKHKSNVIPPDEPSGRARATARSVGLGSK